MPEQNNKHPLDKAYLNNMAREVDKHLPDNHGFVLLAFPFGADEPRRLYFTATCDRGSALNVMREFLLRNGDDAPWLNHSDN